MRTSSPVTIFLFFIASRTIAQAPTHLGPRAVLPRDREITLARSAAPASVSDSATIYVLKSGGWEKAVHGANGVACLVGRSWVESLEPQCFDAEAAATVMLMEMRRTEMYQAGRSQADVDREIGAGLAEGRYRLPRRPAMTYMMSAGQRLISDDGRAVGSWHPHLMIFFPYLTAADLGLGPNTDTKSAIVNDPGKPTANVMVLLSEFIQPRVPTR